jgi:hypothetical protein
MDWKISLDRYLTTPPQNDFDSFCEVVTERFTDDFFDENEDWIMEFDGQFNLWINEIYLRKGYDVDKSARIIERAFALYKLNEIVITLKTKKNEKVDSN